MAAALQGPGHAIVRATLPSPATRRRSSGSGISSTRLPPMSERNGVASPAGWYESFCRIFLGKGGGGEPPSGLAPAGYESNYRADVPTCSHPACRAGGSVVAGAWFLRPRGHPQAPLSNPLVRPPAFPAALNPTVDFKHMIANRHCGDCTACCTAVGVAELSKAPHVRCPHMQLRCTIYAERPKGCKDYSCGWLQGGYSARDRPDKCGLIMEATVGDGPLGPAGQVLVIREVFAGARLKRRAQELIMRIPASIPYVIVCTDDKRVFRCDAETRDLILRQMSNE